ncbi:hypothetical protein F511_12672 [Dorcoceras hygrometricum]|uniref:Uncharacterized protein n=1 Tax=Dorcoceras hygrometricum TaxID=472368 RepID=A0A2Z7AZ13_9LAMI|nr:hypothetical protein F511_12672 [Dorcoceras hygrometricum]
MSNSVTTSHSLNTSFQNSKMVSMERSGRNEFSATILAPNNDDAVEAERVLPYLIHLSGVGYHGYSAGRGVDPAGGAPGGG